MPRRGLWGRFFAIGIRGFESFYELEISSLGFGGLDV